MAARVALQLQRRCAKDHPANPITASVAVRHLSATLIGSTKIGEHFCWLCLWIKFGQSSFTFVRFLVRLCCRCIFAVCSSCKFSVNIQSIKRKSSLPQSSSLACTFVCRGRSFKGRTIAREEDRYSSQAEGEYRTKGRERGVEKEWEPSRRSDQKDSKERSKDSKVANFCVVILFFQLFAIVVYVFIIVMLCCLFLYASLHD